MDLRIGVLPVPVVVLLLAVLTAFVVTGKFPAGAASKTPDDVCTMLAVLALGGFLCGELGKRLPVLKHIGAAAIFATFIPSCLTYYHLIPPVILGSVTDFTKTTNFLYLFIVGSILGMDRTVLIKGFLKIFVPLAAGSLMAMPVGTANYVDWISLAKTCLILGDTGCVTAK